ncbi:MAG TPA: glycosyltransferase family 39 protein, partial [Pyrinomonadaceae bacterium]|nr:glycosyltransferase family 39 protein [Pyrinomonadaceae bacterium]
MNSGKSSGLRLSRNRALLGLAIFLLAFGVRVLSWHDTRLEVGKVQTVVTADYKRVAQLLRDGGLKSFFSSSSPLADLNNLGHPPGYSIMLASIQSLFGSSDSAVQFVQIACDALAAVMIFLIVAELLPLSPGVIAGLLAALSPQFAWNSVLLLPDSISVLPILIAIFLIVRGAKRPRLLTFLLAGALTGISCWLRANIMLLTVFVALAVPLVIKRETKSTSRVLANRRQDASAPWKWRLALAVVCGTLAVVLPLTLRNAIVFHRFIPLSLGAGQTLLEGIADYDREGRFGIPQTDMGIMKQEAEIYQRPDYYGTLFNPDGVERERARLSRGFAVIRSHPFWFAGAMARRASSMVRLERARLISTEPAVSHPLQRGSYPDSVLYPYSMLKDVGSAAAEISVDREVGPGGALTIAGDQSRYGDQAAWTLGLHPDSDYLLETAVKVERGRMRISIVSGNTALSSVVVDALAETKPEDQPFVPLQMAFVTDNGPTRIVVSNEASDVPNPLIKIAPVAFDDLGPARFLWTRYPRFVIHGVQKIFLTALILPLAIMGLLILIF